jgi:hypothetical protein
MPNNIINSDVQKRRIAFAFARRLWWTLTEQFVTQSSRSKIHKDRQKMGFCRINHKKENLGKRLRACLSLAEFILPRHKTVLQKTTCYGPLT